MSRIAALFDMDHTIIWKNSGLSSVQFARKQGMVPLGFLLLGILKIGLYRLSLLNIEVWYERNMGLLAGLSLSDMDRFSRAWFESMIRKTIYRDSVQLIRYHEAQGHRLVIISNSPPFFVRPLAEALGIEEVITSRVEVKEGILTGKLIKPLCYGKGKKEYAAQWAREQGIDLSQSYFYTDSFYDIDLLYAVGFPMVTNPDRRLRKAAISNNWNILTFKRESAF
ncbi:MAG TPA: HAD family hydrolase [Desulfomonilia bacterium]|nr:HAD family hydrolase [Desulfomonilia bacterium]